jgi:hypothetical protein
MRWGYVILAWGVSVCLIGAFLMAFGEGLLGENHTGIATVIGIVGIGIIGTSGAIISGERVRSLKPKN